MKTRPLRFPAKENPNIDGEGIVGLADRLLQYDVKAKYVN